MNNFREWLSDNLRYILLILGILVVLVGLFFGVRAIAGRFGSSQGDEFSSDSVVSTVNTSVQEAESSASSASGILGGELQENAVPEVTELIQNYYTAIENQDVAAVRELCDTLPETEAAKIASSTTKYTDLKVYTKNGLVADSYVVYAYYHYQNEGQSTPLPGLSRMLVSKNSDGAWKIIYSEYDDATSNYIDSLENEDDVKELVEQVQQEYDSAQQSASESTASSAESSDTLTSSEDSSASSASESPDTNSSSETTQAAESSTETSESQEESPAASSAEETPVVTETPKAEERSSGSSKNSTRTTTLNAACFVRSAPSYSGTVLGQLKAGTEVTVIGDIEDGWWHIRAEGYDGYVGRRFIS